MNFPSPSRPPRPGRCRKCPGSGHAPARCRAAGHHRRLVGDQRTHLAGVGGDQRQPDDGSTAAAEDIRRFAAEHRQQAVDVVGLLLGRHVFGGVLAAAVANATRVVGHDGVVAGERAGESGEAGAVHRRADHEQQRAGAPPLVVEPCAGHVQDMGRRIGASACESPFREPLPHDANGRGRAGPGTHRRASSRRPEHVGQRGRVLSQSGLFSRAKTGVGWRDGATVGAELAAQGRCAGRDERLQFGGEDAQASASTRVGRPAARLSRRPVARRASSQGRGARPAGYPRRPPSRRRRWRLGSRIVRGLVDSGGAWQAPTSSVTGVAASAGRRSGRRGSGGPA